MKNKIKQLVRRLKFKYKHINLDKESIKLFWFKDKINFGDYLNKDLVPYFTNKQIDWVPNNYSEEYYMAIGSILHLATDKTIVWGSGLISDNYLPIKSPKEILAVRGPLTRNKLLNAKIKCPEIFGDPALIMPSLFYPRIDKKYELGIIPHYVDKKHKFFFNKFNENVKIIDIEQENYQEFISDVLSCKKIISSSLHGLIISDAYDIPCLRAKFSDQIVGGDFKFNDYFLSVNRLIQKPIYIDETNLESILKSNFNYKKSINISKLCKVNPFNLSL